MQRNLVATTDGDAVQRPLALESRERPLDPRPLSVKGLPSDSLIRLGYSLLVRGVRVNDRLRSILSVDKLPHRIARIACVRHDVIRLEPPVGDAGLSQHVRRSGHIMDIPCAHGRRHWQFGFAVHQKVQLVPVREFLFPMSSAGFE